MMEKPYTIRLANDEMEAWIRFDTEGPLALPQLWRDLENAGVGYGVDEFFLRDLAEARQAGQWYSIAQGEPPETGIEYFFARRPERTPKRLPDGRVDFYNLNTIQNVVQQQILVANIPAEARQPGRTVRGVMIPPGERDEPLPEAGLHVAATADGQALIATINGHPVLEGNCLRVDPV